MSSFMSSFAAFAIKSSGWKRKMNNPESREEYIAKLSEINKKPFDLPTFPYHSLVDKEIMHGVEVLRFNKEKKKKIIYLHGGAYCEPPRILHFIMCDNISYNTDYEIMFPIYKRAPDATFDFTFEFLEKLYRELLSELNAEDIVFMGDSSGGGLALAFCQYLSKINLPQPKRMVLFSPWVDVSMDKPFLPELDSVDPNLVHSFLKVCGKYWAGETDVHDYRVSPIYGDMNGLAPITLYVGTHEALLPDAREIKKKVLEAGGEIDLKEWDNMNHVFVVFPIPEAKEAQSEVIELLNKE